MNEQTQTHPTSTLPIKTGVKAGSDDIKWNHNETQLRRPLRGGLKVKTNIKAGPGGGCGWCTLTGNHSQSKASLKVKTGPGTAGAC